MCGVSLSEQHSTSIKTPSVCGRRKNYAEFMESDLRVSVAFKEIRGDSQTAERYAVCTFALWGRQNDILSAKVLYCLHFCASGVSRVLHWLQLYALRVPEVLSALQFGAFWRLGCPQSAVLSALLCFGCHPKSSTVRSAVPKGFLNCHTVYTSVPPWLA